MNFGQDTWWIICMIATVVIAIIGFFLKRTMTTQDMHSRDINEIKQTYVTKDELKEVKERMLTKQDYYRLQTQTEKKIDKIYDLLLKHHGGGCDNE